MKRFTLAAVLALGALPALAGENAVSDSRAKIDHLLGDEPRYAHDAHVRQSGKSVTASTTIRAAPMNRYERAHQRLFSFRSPPAGR